MKCNNAKGGKPLGKSCFRYYALPSTPYGKNNPYWQWHIGGNMCDTTMPNGKKGPKCDMDKMKKEIMTNGPLFASFKVMQDFGQYKSGVYTHKTGKKRGMHAVMVIGWGKEDGVDYWLIQNSWGKTWGNHGYFKIAAGVNEVGIDSSMMAATPFLKGLCTSKCDQGEFDTSCKCNCHDGWGGAACNKCVRKCTGPQFTGKRDDKACKCACKPGYQGADCTLKVTIPTSVTSGVAFDIKYDDKAKAAKMLMKKGDEIAIFPKASFVWNKKKGWDKMATDAVKTSGKPADKIKTTLYKPGEYQVLRLHWLGTNEFGQDKGYSTTFTKLGTVTVAPCGTKCAKQPPMCKDMISWCNGYKRVCKWATRYNIGWKTKSGKMNREPLNKACAKTCKFCGAGKKPAAKKPPPPPPRRPRPRPRPRPPPPTPPSRPNRKPNRGGSSCADSLRYSQPYKKTKYKYKRYKSRCAYYKIRDLCSRFWVKTKCQKTCTGAGSDNRRYSRPTSGRVYQTQKFDTKCDYFKERGFCKFSYYKRSCENTCTGGGQDRPYNTKPYKASLPVVAETVTYSSKCAFFKKRGQCRSRWMARRMARYCKKTCGKCSAAAWDEVIPEE